jgi:Cobalamin biosynthesis protein CobT (nicotinate-mononucleotide:5, 6-dimethylbenzimidazole phosphoribosyltransferase)
MENNNGIKETKETGGTPKKAGGIVLDILTIGMLFAAFAALFYSAFILQSQTFPIGAMCAITAVGLLLLFFIGDVSCLTTKSKNRTLTLGFLVFSAVQLAALIVNLALLLGIMSRLFAVTQLESRLLYAVTVSIILIGYVASVSYFSSSSEEIEGSADEEDEEAYEEEEEVDEEEVEESGEEEESDGTDGDDGADGDDAVQLVDLMDYQENL